MNNKIYNFNKIPSYYKDFLEKKVLVVGAGAVGSYIGEQILKTLTGRITFMDMDYYDIENYSKSSGLIRMPDDLKKNKAIIMAKRVEPLLAEGASSNYLSGEVMKIGPDILGAYDVVFLGLDNFAAKIYINQIWLQLPQEDRPILIMAGTDEETASSVVIDGKSLCLRCNINEASLKDPTKKTSCYIKYKNESDISEHVITSGLASSICANLACEQYRAIVKEGSDFANRQINYTSYPNIFILESQLSRKKKCPDCNRFFPHNDVKLLKGNMMKTKVKEVIEQIRNILGRTDFDICINNFDYANVSYYRLIVEDYCRCCGKKIEKLYKHEGYIAQKDVLCDVCKDLEDDKETLNNSDLEKAKVIYGISESCNDEDLLNKSMYEIGFPLGGYIKVVIKNDAVYRTDEQTKISFFKLDGDKEMAFQNIIL